MWQPIVDSDTGLCVFTEIFIRLQMALGYPAGHWRGHKDGDYYDGPEWKNAARKSKWETKDVPGDGMCGWASIMLVLGRLTLDDMLLRNKKPIAWSPEGWRKLLAFFKEVSNFILTSLEGPRNAQQDHLIGGIEAKFNDTGADNITLSHNAFMSKKMRALQLAADLNPTEGIEQPEVGQLVHTDVWFRVDYGMIVSAMLNRPILIVQFDYYGLRKKLSFPFFTPKPLDRSFLADEGIKQFYGTCTAFTLDKVRQVMESGAWSDPVQVLFEPDKSHYQPFYQKRKGADGICCALFLNHCHHMS